MTNFLQVLRHGLRLLAKSPGFTIAATVVLALGIGTNTAIFSVINAVLLRPLPFADPARLVMLWHTPPPKSFPGMTTFSVSAANFLDWQQQSHAFDRMAIYSFTSLNLTGREQPEALQGAAVSSDFFSTLQSKPVLGRVFRPEEDQPGKNHAVILSYGLWKSRFGGNPNLIGQLANFDGQPYTIAGVMDSKFRFPSWAQFWTPMGWTDKERAVRGEHHYMVVARLAPGSAVQHAQAEISGIDPHNILTMTVGVPRHKYSNPADEIRFFDRALTQIRALPGVTSAGLIDNLPMSGDGSHQPVAIEGRPPLSLSDQPEVDTRVITPGYLQTMHISVHRGRDISDSDAADRAAVVLISEAMARRFWPNEDPVGRHLTMSFFPDKSREIVGIVGDVKLENPAAATSPGTVYVPATQLSVPAAESFDGFPMQLAVRTSSSPTSLSSAVSGAIHSVDGDAPLSDIMTMDDLIANSLAQRRFSMLLLATFAALALLLAAVGIYSVLAFTVRRRVREIGIRMALGAELQDVVRLVVAEGMEPALLGVAIGLAGALALGRVAASLIYGITATDPLTFASVAILLCTVALLATLIPALRATRIEPTRALRDE